ncbi:MAG: RidA family protein [Sulfolobales archaeon]|nr:RidA family protein [Sulfolobales archaeon]MCX8186157.1 RidA family protein [Sulfolobales archaeon]MDW7969452.1 RidA family protein [Sulfolobales archaeon]
MIKSVFTDNAPKPVGPYSQGVIAGCLLFISGQIPIDPRTGELVEGDFRAKVRRVLENVKSIVEVAGGRLEDVVKVTVFLRDIKQFQVFNEVYSEYFKINPPARSLVEVSNLPRGADVEIEAVAYICRNHECVQ